MTPVLFAGGGLFTLIVVQVLSPDTMSRRFWWLPHVLIGLAVICLLITLRTKK